MDLFINLCRSTCKIHNYVWNYYLLLLQLFKLKFGPFQNKILDPSLATIYLDLAKALGTVDHTILLIKIIGISGILLLIISGSAALSLFFIK